MSRQHAVLDWIERNGNRLPDPATLFLLGTIVIIALSGLIHWLDWSVSKPLLKQSLEQAPEIIQARNLLSSDGIWWLLSNLVTNFIHFPPLGIVLVGMLGIGLAEKSGFIPALLTAVTQYIRPRYLSPAMVFLGIMSSLGLDAGYVVLPPLAALLYQSMGRSPLAGIAAVFAGVSAGFSANLFITGIDPLMAGLTQSAAQFLDPDYQVAVSANWWFMIVSTVLLTLAGWAVSAIWVEPRLSAMDPSSSNAPVVLQTTADVPALRHALIALCFSLLIYLLMIYLPGAPLAGQGKHFARWVETIVPVMLVLFFIPGLVFGISSGRIRNDRDIARMLGETLSALGPYIVLAFFAAQFIALFNYSHLGEMLAISGGEWLASLQIPHIMLIEMFILVVMLGNLMIGSASAKYAFFAPVFIPMFMQVGISPELTQAAYRVGDSVTNVITPLNPYMVIILAQVQLYARKAGLGTIVSLMLPYSLVFGIVWSLLILFWIMSGLALGPGGELHYP